MAANANAADEKFVSATPHRRNLTLTNLLHVGISFRLEQILAIGVPSASIALLGLLQYDGALDDDHIDKFVEAEYLVRSLAEECVNVGLWVLSMIVQKDTSGRSMVHQTAIGGCHRLEYNIIANVVLD